MRWIVFFFILACASTHSIPINRAIISSDANRNYIEFWPIVAQAWQNIVGVKPTLILVAHADTAINDSYGDVIRFEPLEGIPTSFQAQTIRNLYASLFPHDFCIVTDIDMIPLNREYYVKGAEQASEDALVLYRPDEYHPSEKRYPMCYSAAKGSTFAEIFGIRTIEDIRNVIRQWYQLGLRWPTDELMLYKAIHEWPGHQTRLFKVYDNPVNRIDRVDWNYDRKQVAQQKYTECHAPRPYSYHRADIDELIAALGITPPSYDEIPKISWYDYLKELSKDLYRNYKPSFGTGILNSTCDLLGIEY